jgi:hypothetical protein
MLTRLRGPAASAGSISQHTSAYVTKHQHRLNSRRMSLQHAVELAYLSVCVRMHMRSYKACFVRGGEDERKARSSYMACAVRESEGRESIRQPRGLAYVSIHQHTPAQQREAIGKRAKGRRES